MKRSRLRNKFLNTKSGIDRKAYNKQRNLCVSLIGSEKKNFFRKKYDESFSFGPVTYNDVLKK